MPTLIAEAGNDCTSAPPDRPGSPPGTAEAVLSADGPVTSLVELTLVAEHRRGHGAMNDALGYGRIEPERLRRTLASLSLSNLRGQLARITVWTALTRVLARLVLERIYDKLMYVRKPGLDNRDSAEDERSFSPGSRTRGDRR